MEERLHFSVDLGAPEYGSSLDPEVLSEEPDAEIDLEVEVSAQKWRPIPPDPAVPPARSVLFSDGVERLDARIWIPDGDVSGAGWCASYAAGVVRCDGRAEVQGVEMRRSVFASARKGKSIPLARAGEYEFVAIAADTAESARRELQRRLRDLEVSMIKAAGSADLVVVDGHLRGREDTPEAIGYVKSHQSSYLKGEVRGVVAQLAPGERTPVFLIQSSWTRYSWYLRLAVPSTSHRAIGGHPWAGIVRCEAAPSLTAEEAIRRATRASVTLPRFSSVPYKDPRAPQNLYPIGALEQRLRHLLGDRDLVRRDLIQAAG